MPAQSLPESSDHGTYYRGLPGNNWIFMTSLSLPSEIIHSQLVHPTYRKACNGEVMDRLMKGYSIIPSRSVPSKDFVRHLLKKPDNCTVPLKRRIEVTCSPKFLRITQRRFRYSLPAIIPSSGTVDDLMTFMNVILTREVAFPECLVGLQSEKSQAAGHDHYGIP